MLNIFNAYGSISRTALESEAATIDALPDADRKTLFACIKAVTDRDAGVTRANEARHDLRNKEMAHAAALDADQKANPPPSHQSELARVIAANQGRTITPVKLNKKARAALTEAETALTGARITLQKATAELRTLETKAGEAINAWRLRQSTPSAQDVVREYQARGNEERARIAAENPRAPNQASPLDEIMLARGKTKPNRRPQYFAR